MPHRMNARERWGLLLIDEFPDRPPVFPLVTSHSAVPGGIDLVQYSTRGRALAEAQLQAQAKYGHDGLAVFTDVGIIAEAMGSKYHIRDYDVPILDSPFLKSTEMIGELQVPDPTKAGRLPVYLEAIDYLFQAKGDVLPVFAFIPCPFTTAAGLRGVEGFLMDTLLDPEAAKQILEISLEAAVKLCDECILMGALPIVVDPLASGSVISRRTYREFALPYEERLISYLHRYDLDITLHICGDTTSFLDLIPTTGADLFSFDKAPVGDCRKAMGEKVRLVGNLAPHDLLGSSKLDVPKAVGEIVGEGIMNPRGFVLSTGCEVPIKCDARRLEALIAEGMKAKYEFVW